MSASQRRKGRIGQSIATKLLTERDYIVDSIACGIRAEDLIATDQSGKSYSVEVKNVASILPSHKKQAMEQSRVRKLPWMLMNKISGTTSWLIQRQGERPQIWHEKET